MAAGTTPGENERLQQVLALVEAKVAAADRATIEELVRRYYGQVDPEDLALRQPADLYGAALSHWSFARKREPGRAKVRVFNPTIEEHGWQSTHTIIEIVNDDMPFLVDSVTMEVNRHGLTLHLIMHPLLAVVRDAGGHADRPRARRQGRRGGNRSSTSKSTGPPTRRGSRRSPPTSRACWRDVRMAVEDWKKMQDKMLAIVAELDAHPPPLPADELAEGKAFLSWLAEQPLHAAGLPLPRPRHRRRRGRAAHRPRLEPRHPARDRRPRCRGELRRAAAGTARVRAAARAAHHHQVELALDGASSRLSRLRRRQALRRERAGVRRASLPRPLHVDRVQREAGRHSAAAAQDGQRRRARGPRARAAMPARRSSTSSTPIRATSCSRRARTTSTRPRWASCISASGSASGCSCAAIRSGASCRASSSRRARTTRPSCARSGRRS